MAARAEEQRDERWLTPGVGGIGAASLLADLGHEVPTALLPTFLTSTLGAPAAALGLIEGIADGLRGSRASPAARSPTIRTGGAARGRRLHGDGGLLWLIGVATAVWQVGVLRAGPGRRAGCACRPATRCSPTSSPRRRTDAPTGSSGRWTTSARSAGRCSRSRLVALVGTRDAMLVSVIPGLLAAVAIVYAIRATPRATEQERKPLRSASARC